MRACLSHFLARSRYSSRRAPLRRRSRSNTSGKPFFARQPGEERLTMRRLRRR